MLKAQTHVTRTHLRQAGEGVCAQFRDASRPIPHSGDCCHMHGRAGIGACSSGVAVRHSGLAGHTGLVSPRRPPTPSPFGLEPNPVLGCLHRGSSTPRVKSARRGGMHSSGGSMSRRPRSLENRLGRRGVYIPSRPRGGGAGSMPRRPPRFGAGGGTVIPCVQALPRPGAGSLIREQPWPRTALNTVQYRPGRGGGLDAVLSAKFSAYVPMDGSGLTLPQFYVRLRIHKQYSTISTGLRSLILTTVPCTLR